MTNDRSTLTALAARAFMDRIDSNVPPEVIVTCARLGGWAGAREAGMRDTRVSDAIAEGAVRAVMDLFRSWAAECDEGASADPLDLIEQHDAAREASGEGRMVPQAWVDQERRNR